MIERHVSFQVPTDKAADFERFFVEKYRPPVIEMPGLIECVLLREADDPTRYQIVFRWQSADDAVAWRNSLAHQDLQPALALLNEDMAIVAYTQVA